MVIQYTKISDRDIIPFDFGKIAYSPRLRNVYIKVEPEMEDDTENNVIRKFSLQCMFRNT